MATAGLDPSWWTLRLKHHKTTVVLSAEPDTDFRAIKTELLRTLKLTYPSGKLNGHDIPSDPDDVFLGKLRNVDDPREGWTTIDVPEANGDGAAPAPASSSANGARKRAKLAKLDCPQGAGLQDWAALAFQFKNVQPSKGDGKMDVDSVEWDVVTPSYEDDEVA